MSVQPEHRFAHSAGSGLGTPNPDDEVATRDDDDQDEHTSTRTTGAGVEAGADAVTGPSGAARIEHAPPEESFEALRNPTG